MISFKLIPFLLFFMIGLHAHAFGHSDIAAKKSKQNIQKMFGSEVDLVAFESNPNYYSIYQQDSLIAYYCIEQAPSKHDVFEFMVVYVICYTSKKYKCLFTELVADKVSVHNSLPNEK